MKTRIITGVLLAFFVTPFVVLGSYYFAIFILILFGLSLYEFLNAKKEEDEKTPIYIYVLSAIFGLLLIFDIPVFKDYSFDYVSGILPKYSLNILWISLFALSLFISSVFDKRFSIMRAFYTFATILYLSLGLKGLLYLRSYHNVESSYHGMYLIAFVLLVTCFSDIFAYFGGMLCKKILKEEKLHKLNERVSPKKTIEGFIIGTTLATVSGFLFGYFVLNKMNILVYPFYIYIIISLFVSLVGQMGDLILSDVKRYFEIKDYSNLLPGHGGVLDRIDSLLANSIVMSLLITLFLMIF